MFNNEFMICWFWVLAGFRIYLEIIGFDMKRLPLSQYFKKYIGQNKVDHIHRWGFYASVGHIVLFAPDVLRILVHT